MKIRLKQIRSAIGTTQKQKGNLQSLNLGRIGKVSEFESTPAVLGRIRVIRHLVEVENC